MKQIFYILLTNFAFNSLLNSQCANATFPTIGSNTTTICAGGSVTFTRTGTSNIGGFIGFEWVYSTSSGNCASSTFFSSLSNPSPNNVSWTFPTAGTYYVRMRAIANSGACAIFWPNGQCSPGQELVINVLSAPTFTMGPSTRFFCPGTPATLTPTLAGSPSTFQWRKNNIAVPGATLATLNFPVTTAGDAGIYNLVATSSCGTATSSPITFTTLTPGNIMGNTNVLLNTSNNYSTTPATGLTYTWSQAGTATITSGVNTTSINVNAPSSPSIYTISLARGVATCVATSTLAVNAVSCFSLNGTAGLIPVVNHCNGAPINFYYSYTPTGTVVPSFSWVGPNSFTSSISNPTITSASFANAGIYTLTVNNAGCITTSTVSANIVGSPTINLTSSSASICSGSNATLNVTGGNSYTWTPSVPMSWVISPSVSATYTVVGEGSFGCKSSATLTQFVQICTHLNEKLSINSEVNLYPNPVKNYFVIEGAVDSEIIIIDILGKRCLNQKITQNENSIDVSSLVKGIYFVEITSGNRNSVKRILIE